MADGRPITLALTILTDAKKLNDCKDRHKALSDVVKFREKLMEIWEEK